MIILSRPECRTRFDINSERLIVWAILIYFGDESINYLLLCIIFIVERRLILITPVMEGPIIVGWIGGLHRNDENIFV